MFHSLDTNEVLGEFQTSPEGLSSQSAHEIFKRVGPNSLPQGKKRGIGVMIIEQLKSTLIIILIIAALLSFVLEQSYVDAAVILSIVIINTLIGVMQEYKTERTLEHLKNLLTPQARVLRDGKLQIISSLNVVPGDILLIDEGEKIVADARVIFSQGLRVNQAILTGESVAQEKTTRVIPLATPLSDRNNMLYQGTTVAAGSGKAVVIATGSNTELGHISGMVSQIQEEPNPFNQKLEDFSRKISIFISILCAIIVLSFLIEGDNFSHSFLVAVSLAVSAIPEGLPAVVALGLAFATKRLLKRNVLVRKLPSSETLGRVTVICTDKTGTLTCSEMKVVDQYSDGKLSTNPTKLLLEISVLCNKAGFGLDTNGKEILYGDPTEIGLIQYAQDHGIIKAHLEKEIPSIYEFPFDSERKRMSVIRNTSDKFVSYVKGAPERILELSTGEVIDDHISPLTSSRKREILETIHVLSRQGKRVLAFAYRELEKKESYSLEESESDLVFVGLMAMIDPPRPEVVGAIKKCQEAGIRVIMVTGDAELTAGTIAQMVGLNNTTIDATKLSEMSDVELSEKIKTTDVFSRIAPQDKLRIVRTLRAQGYIIAMTGDGVNDALALKQADIGIAMGIRGTDVARDASDMVLTDDNFASIVSGVEEGRRIYDNTKKFIKFLLACNFYEVFLVAFFVLLFRDPLIVPFLAIQILWINLVTDSVPALALSTQPTERDVMKHKPENHGLLDGIYTYIVVAGLIGFGIVGWVFYRYYSIDLALAQTLAVTTSVTYQMALAISSARLGRFDLRINHWLFIAIFSSMLLHFFLLASPLASVFKFVPLSQIQPEHYLYIFGLPLLGYVLVEFTKGFHYRPK